MSGSSSSQGPTTAAPSSSQGPPPAGGTSSVSFPSGPSASRSNAPAESSSSGLTEDHAVMNLDAMSVLGSPVPSLIETMEKIARLKSSMAEKHAEMMAIAERGHRLADADGKSQEPPVYTEADIPGLVEALSSTDEKVFYNARRVLYHISNAQQDLMHSTVLPLFPSIVPLIFTASTEVQRGDLVNLLIHINCRTREASEALAKHMDVEGLIGLLLKASSNLRDSIVKLLESLMYAAARFGDNGDGGKMEHRVVEALHTQFYTFEPLDQEDSADGGKASGKGKAKAPKAVRWNTADAFNAIETFKALLMRRVIGTLGNASIQAGVLGFLLQVATTASVVDPSSTPSATGAAPSDYPATPTLSSVRVAAVSGLSEFYLAVVEQSILPDGAYQEGAQFDLQGQILMPLLDILDDPDLPVSDKVVELLYTRFNDLDQAVQIFLWTHEGSMQRLIRKLALGSASDSGGAKGDGGKGKGKGGKGKSKRERPASLMDLLGLGSRPGLEEPAEERGPTGHFKSTEMFAKSVGLELPQKPGYPLPVEGIPAKVDSTTNDGHIGEELSTLVKVDQGGLSLVDVIVGIGGKKSGEEVEMVDMSTKAGDDKMNASAGEVKGERAPEVDPGSEMMNAGAQGEDQVTEQNPDTEMLDVSTQGKDKEPSAALANLDAKPAGGASLTIPAFPSFGALTGGLGLSDSFLEVLNKMNSRPKIEPLLNLLLGHNPEGVIDAFTNFWVCETLEEGMREKLLQVLSEMHGGLRVAATNAGIPVPECEHMGEAESFSPFL